MRVIVGLAIIVGILWYLAYQSRNLLEGPEIILHNNPETIQHSRTIFLEGETRNIISLSMNGSQLFTDEKGVFKKKLVLENGYTIMTLRATDRFGRETSVRKSFVYIPTDSIN